MATLGPSRRLTMRRLFMRLVPLAIVIGVLTVSVGAAPQQADGKKLFERETFGGNGRTCRTCHSRTTGTISPIDAQELFVKSPDDPLFRGDGSDDGLGQGVMRMLTDATILMHIPLATNVSLL